MEEKTESKRLVNLLLHAVQKNHSINQSNMKRHLVMYDYTAITGALQMCYSGMSARGISNHYKMMRIEISDVIVYE